MKLIYVTFFSALFFSLFYLFSKIFMDFDDVDIKKIEAMISSKKYKESADYIKLKISKYPDNGLLYYYMGKIFFLKGDYEDAIKYLDFSIKLGFPMVDSFNLKAVIYGEGFKNFKAQKEFAKKAIEIDPTDYEGYLIRARACFNLGEYENALSDFEIAYEIEKDENILLEKSITLLRLKKFKEAIKILYELNKKYKNNETIMYNLYLGYKNLGYYNNSIYLISKLYDITKNAYYLREKALLLFELGDYEYSKIEFEKYKNSAKFTDFDRDFYLRIKSKIKYN